MPTVVVALKGNSQVTAVPLHGPLHPPKIELAPGVAVRDTICGVAMTSSQSVSQSSPPGPLTRPAPAPEKSSNSRGRTSNIAVTDTSPCR
jgi:hypothetical protein